MQELFYRKTKNGWECRDRIGQVAEGLTKDMAHNNYCLMYETKNNSFCPIDITKYNVKLNK